MRRHFDYRMVAFHGLLTALAALSPSGSVDVGVGRHAPPTRDGAAASTRSDAPAPPWLQGELLAGVVSGAARGAPARIAVRSFRGVRVHIEPATEAGGRGPAVVAATELVGLHWLERRCRGRGRCRERLFRVAGVHRDAARNTMSDHGDNRDVALYRVQYTIVDEAHVRGWRDVCRADETGFAGGLFVDGQWTPDGAWRASGYTFACTGGVIAKCVRNWGYKPWKQVRSRAGQRVDLRPFHLACTRALRADYCGDGSPHTRDGTPVALLDRHGLNRDRPGPSFTLEAGFTPDGAAWMQRVRVRGATRQAASGRSICVRPTRPRAADPPALLVVWSRPDPALP